MLSPDNLAGGLSGQLLYDIISPLNQLTKPLADLHSGCTASFSVTFYPFVMKLIVSGDICRQYVIAVPVPSLTRELEPCGLKTWELAHSIIL